MKFLFNLNCEINRKKNNDMYTHKDAIGWHCRPWQKGKRLYKGGFKTKKAAEAWGKTKESKKK